MNRRAMGQRPAHDRRPAARWRAAFGRRLTPLGLLAGMTVAGVGGLAPVVVLAAPASAATGSACTGTIAGVTVTGGSAQTAKVGEGFSNPLQAEVIDTGGCPVSGVDVEFVAPTSGPSATFPGAATNATVETSTSGVASAPTLTANEVSGSYTVLAEVANTGIEADFDLTNTTAGEANELKASSGNDQSAKVGAQFALPLTVTVTDAYGDPVPDETVAFSVVTTSGAGATFVGGGSSATAQTDQSGVATSPALTAGSAVGAYTVTASVSRVERHRHLQPQERGLGALRHRRRGGDVPGDRARHRLRRAAGGDGDRQRRQRHLGRPGHLQLPRPAGPAGPLPARGPRPS